MVDEHPNMPRRGALTFAFFAILVAGALGGTIGWGLIDTSCSEQPTFARRLLEVVPGYEQKVSSCDVRLVGGAVAGTLVAAIGAGIVAMLMLRAMSEWRAHPPGRPDGRPDR